jgi:hypothetical protein
MAWWAIYVMDAGRLQRATGERREPGTLYDLVDTVPDREYTWQHGLACAYFGEDPPDQNALEWCPRRLSFMSRASAADSDAVRALDGRLRIAHAELLALDRRVAELEAKASPRPPARRRREARCQPPAGLKDRLRRFFRREGNA